MELPPPVMLPWLETVPAAKAMTPEPPLLIVAPARFVSEPPAVRVTVPTMLPLLVTMPAS